MALLDSATARPRGDRDQDRRGRFLVLGMTGHESSAGCSSTGRAGRRARHARQAEGSRAATSWSARGPRSQDDHRRGRRSPLFQRLRRARCSGARRVGRFDSFTATLKPWLWFATRAGQQQGLPGEERQGDHHRGPRRLHTEATSNGGSISARCTRSSTTASSTTKATSTSSAGCMEEVGIYYFFEHEDGKHTLVLIDAMAKHKSRPGQGPDHLGATRCRAWPAITTGTCRKRRARPRRC